MRVELGLRPHLAEYYSRFIPKYPFDMVVDRSIQFWCRPSVRKNCLKEKTMRKYTG